MCECEQKFGTSIQKIPRKMSIRPESSPAMPLVSGLSVARPASAMGGIDPGASPEPVPRSALVSAEPFADPARARRVAGAARTFEH